MCEEEIEWRTLLVLLTLLAPKLEKLVLDSYLFLYYPTNECSCLWFGG